jgi:HEAT repeat protein
MPFLRPRAARALLGALVLLSVAATARAGEAERDLEPAPPWIFFRVPDDETTRVLEVAFANSSGDFNKVVGARDLIVRRIHVWSVDRLALELTGPVNEPAQLNALLTVCALRGHVGPAPELAKLIKPLIDIARNGAEPWRRAFALLALGSFHGVEGIGRPRQRKDVLIGRDVVDEMRRAYENDVPMLFRNALRDPFSHVRIAAALALGKTGGALSRFDLQQGSLVLQGNQEKDASTEAEMAAILALGLLNEPYDQDRLVGFFQDNSARVRAAAALAIALQAVSYPPPAWTADPGRALDVLSSARISQAVMDAPEAMFARGCLAWLRQRADVWDAVLAAAVEATAEGAVATAAAQALVWCGDPTLHAKMLRQLTANRATLQQQSHHAVLAAFLLRAGWDASAEGVRVCRDWLGNAPREPRADHGWDPRWHACVGLLRALADGRPADPAERREVVAALDAAVERGLHREALLLPELQNLLRTHRTLLLTTPGSRLPDGALRAAEGVVRCRYHLLAHDLRDTAIARANAMLFGPIFDLEGLRALAAGKEKDKDGSAKRYLEKYLAAWPYLSRLDVLADRGRRPPNALAFDDPGNVLDRP